MMGRYHDVTYGILHLLGAGTSIANPILYGYMNENFRNEYRKFYHKMPWYRSSKLFVKNLRSQMSQKPLTKVPSNSSIESGPVVTQRPKGLRKLKDSQLMMSHLGVSSSHSCHSNLIKRESHSFGHKIHQDLELSHNDTCDLCHNNKCDHKCDTKNQPVNRNCYQYHTIQKCDSNKSCDKTPIGHRNSYENKLFEPDHRCNTQNHFDTKICDQCHTIKKCDPLNKRCDKTPLGHKNSFENKLFKPDHKCDTKTQLVTRNCDQCHTLKKCDPLHKSCDKTLLGHRNSYENKLFEPDHKCDNETQLVTKKCDPCHTIQKCDTCPNNIKTPLGHRRSFESNYGSFDSKCDTETQAEKCDQSHRITNTFLHTENEKVQRSKSLKLKERIIKPKVKKTMSYELKQLPEDSLPILERGTPKSLSFRIKKPPIHRKLSEIIEKPHQYSSKVNYIQRSISLNPSKSQHIRFTITNDKSDSEETAL